MNLRANSLPAGIAIGVLVPVLTYGILTLIFNLLTSAGIMDPSGFSPTWRLRTVTLLAICANIFPFNWHKRKRHNDGMRGMVFPTFLFVVVWFFYFKDHLLNQG